MILGSRGETKGVCSADVLRLPSTVKTGSLPSSKPVSSNENERPEAEVYGWYKSETNKRKEYLACLSAAGSVPSLLWGSTAEVSLRPGSGVAGPGGQGPMAAARDGPGITGNRSELKKKKKGIDYLAQ